jgi:serine/threonine protein kinase
MPVFKVGATVNGYKLIRCLSDQAGAEGIPFEARAPDGRQVFIKQFLRHKPRSPEGATFLRIQKELKNKLSLIPRFVSTIEAVFEHDNSFVQVAEWVDGTSLSSAGEELSFEQRYLNATLLAFAVKTVHQQGIAHLDMKPDNVIIERRRVEDESGGIEFIEVVRVIDFDAAVIEGIPRTTDCLGTVLYMSPEHVRPKSLGLPGRPADVFSLAIMISELLTGYYPFEVDDFQEDNYFSRRKFIETVKARRVKSLHHLSRAIPTEVSRLIADCLALHPEDRPTAEQVHDCLIKNQPSGDDVEDASPLVCEAETAPRSEALPEIHLGLTLEWKYGRIELGKHGRRIIGRSEFEPHLPEAEKRFANRISRRHARFYQDEGRWMVSRLSQHNRLKVNEESIECLQFKEVSNGDEVTLGPVRLTARIGV